MSAQPPSFGPPAVQPGHVMLEHEASLRGFRNPLAFKRFCKRIGVEIRKVGKMLFVQPAEVDAGIARHAVSHPVASSNENVQRAIEQLTRKE